MSSPSYTPEFKDEAVRQVVDRGHSFAEVAERQGVSIHGLYAWINAVKPSKNEQQIQGLNDAKPGRQMVDAADAGTRTCRRRAVEGRVASRYRSANDSDSTHWRTGCCGKTLSTSSAAVSAIRRAPQLLARAALRRAVDAEELTARRTAN